MKSKNSVILFFIVFGFASKVWAVNWEEKFGVGGVIETGISVLGSLTSSGLSFIYGVAKGIRIGFDIGIISVSSSLSSGEKEVTSSLFGASFSFNLPIDISSKENFSLYIVPRVGYGSASSKAEGERGEVTPEASSFGGKIGLGIEGFLKGTDKGGVGVAFEGDVFSYSAGKVSEKGSKVDVTSSGFAIFPSARIIVRLYF